MITVTCDRCGIDITREIAQKIFVLNKAKDRESLDNIGWMLSMDILFNVLFKRPFFFCKKCTGITSLEELGKKQFIDFDRLRLYRQWKDSDKRGPELSNEIKKKRVRVLIGDHSWENIGPVISDYIQKQFSKNYDLTFSWSWYCEEIMELAEKKAIEI